MTPAERYTRTAMALHWAVALLILANVALVYSLGVLPDGFARPFIDLHKSIGLTVLALALGRLVWRLTHRPPPFPPGYAPWERRAAQAAHLALYGLIFAMPISGWLHDSAFAAAASHPLRLYWVIPWFRLAWLKNLPPAAKNAAHARYFALHVWLSYALYAVLAAHVLGALKHQFLDRAPELQRMLPKGTANRPG